MAHPVLVVLSRGRGRGKRLGGRSYDGLDFDDWRQRSQGILHKVRDVNVVQMGTPARVAAIAALPTLQTVHLDVREELAFRLPGHASVRLCDVPCRHSGSAGDPGHQQGHARVLVMTGGLEHKSHVWGQRTPLSVPTPASWWRFWAGWRLLASVGVAKEFEQSSCQPLVSHRWPTKVSCLQSLNVFRQLEIHWFEPMRTILDMMPLVCAQGGPCIPRLA